MDRKGANTFPFYNLPPEPREISLRNFSVLLSFPIGENKRRWRLLLTATFREPALKQSVPDPPITELATLLGKNLK